MSEIKGRSAQMYECFVCKNNGFPNEMAYLCGKDEKGRTLRENEDGTAHTHKSKAPSQQQQQSQQRTFTPRQPDPLLKEVAEGVRNIDHRLDAIEGHITVIRNRLNMRHGDNSQEVADYLDERNAEQQGQTDF